MSDDLSRGIAAVAGLRIPMRGYEVCNPPVNLPILFVTNPHEGL